MAGNRPPRRDGGDNARGGGMERRAGKAALPPGPERNPDEEGIITGIPTRRAISRHNPEA